MCFLLFYCVGVGVCSSLCLAVCVLENVFSLSLALSHHHHDDDIPALAVALRLLLLLVVVVLLLLLQRLLLLQLVVVLRSLLPFL